MKIKTIAGLAALAGGVIAASLTGVGSANAATGPTTASTQVNDRPDGGHGAGTTWADDTFVRTLTINVDTTAGDCGTVIANDTCYLVAISDSGTFTTIPNRGAPNLNSPATGSAVTVGFPAVSGQMSGSDSYAVYASASPSAATVPATEDDKGTTPVVTATSDWYKLAFPGTTTFGTPVPGAYSYVYKTACESWTDSSTNGDGNQTGDGNITGKVCPVAVTPTGSGDVINKYLNGLDVFRQAPVLNNRIIVFPVTAKDPAVKFSIIPVGKGSFAFEYAPRGVDTGLCVSLAVGSEPKGSAKTGLVLRGCFTPWEAFKIKDTGNGSFQLVNVATGLVIQPNGTRSQFTGVKSSTAAGSFYGWNMPGAVPAR